jgi:hypothetical protein
MSLSSAPAVTGRDGGDHLPRDARVVMGPVVGKPGRRGERRQVGRKRGLLRRSPALVDLLDCLLAMNS